MNKSVLVIMEALNAFAFDGIAMGYVRYGSGHINDTYLVKTRMSNGTESRVILQRMNTSVFKEPEKLMENIVGVTSFLRERNCGKWRKSRQRNTKCYFDERGQVFLY